MTACSGGAASTGTAGGAGSTTGPATPLATTAAIATQAAASGSAAGLCGTFTTDEVTALVTSPARLNDTTNPTACAWVTDNEATVTVVKADEVVCEAEKAAVQGFGKGTFDGDYFAGPSSTGASVAGLQSGNLCYEVRVDPSEKAPDSAALLAFLKTFVQRAGA